MSNKKYAYINKDMLVWARSKTPFVTTSDVEDYKKKIKAEKLELWEKGDELPSITEAKELSKLYKVPFACFFLSEPPEKEPKRYIDRRTKIGTAYREISYELWKEIERIKHNRVIMMEYDMESDYSYIPSFDEKKSISDISNVMRDYLGITSPYKAKNRYDNNAFRYFRNLFESKGIIVAQVAEVSLDEMKGLSIYYDRFPIIAVNNKDYERAKVFSLFHELAHIIRRNSSLCMIDFDDRNDKEEKLCDKIAAEILMPEAAFKVEAEKNKTGNYDDSDYSLIDIADKFAVSTTAVLRRLYELKRISYSDYQNVYKKLSDEFQAKIESEKSKVKDNFRIEYYKTFLSREGYLFPRTIVDAYYRGDLSYGEMCGALNLNSKHINKIEQAVM